VVRQDRCYLKDRTADAILATLLSAFVAQQAFKLAS
jgi:hypothetical protein